MNQARVLYHLVKADFLQRVRSYSFLLSLAGASYIAYTVVSEKTQLHVGNNYRGIYNSAWLGALMTVTCAVFLTLVGFYIVKNGVQRDAETRVGQILATTPMKKAFYTLGKTISNFAVLAAMVGVLMIVAFGMQFLRAEDPHVNLWKLWSPFLIVALPAMAVTAALAVLFETVPVLRSGAGNVIYFFVWTAALAMGATNHDDFAGMHIFFASMRDALAKFDPGSKDGSFSFTIGNHSLLRTFLWEGVAWTPKILLGRVFWVLVAICIALLASVFFHRFDPALQWVKRKRVAITDKEYSSSSAAMITQSVSSPLTPLRSAHGKHRFAALVVSELRLLLQGKRWWWYAIAGGLMLGSAVGTQASSQGFLLAAWLWPILVWSQLGCREIRYGTEALLYSSPQFLTRQLPASWMAGVLITAATGCGAGLRLLFAHDMAALLGWIAAILFIPAVALCLGVWSGSSKAFEALYTVWWYVGPAHQTPGLDFIGQTSRSYVLYFLLAAGLLAVSYLGRRSRMAYA